MSRWWKLALFVLLIILLYPWWRGMMVGIGLRPWDGNVVYVLWFTVAGWILWRNWSTQN